MPDKPSDCSDAILVLKRAPESSMFGLSKAPEHRETMIFADPDTQFVRKDASLELSEGKLVLLTGNHNESLNCQFCILNLPANSCSVIELKQQDKSVKVANLDSNQLKLTVQDKARKAILSLSSGEELCFRSDQRNELLETKSLLNCMIHESTSVSKRMMAIQKKFSHDTKMYTNHPLV